MRLSERTQRDRTAIGCAPLRASAVLLTLGVAAIAMATAGGCNYLGAAFVLAHGPAKIPPVYELDPKTKTVIFIDDLSNRVPRRSLRDKMGETADQELLENKVIREGDLISSLSARRAASSDTAEEQQSAVDVGRKVGAQIMIYVTMTGWTLQQDPGFISPAAGAQVRILDVVNNTRLWPEGDKTFPLVVRMQRESGEIGSSLAEKSKWEAKLAERFGVDLGKLFYEHTKESLSQQARPGMN